MTPIRVLEDRTPSGDLEEGFAVRDTESRDIALVHPGMKASIPELQKRYDVFVCRLIPPYTAYFVVREDWPGMHERLQEDIMKFRGM